MSRSSRPFATTVCHPSSVTCVTESGGRTPGRHGRPTHRARLCAGRRPRPPWDGLWRLYTFSVPERRRPERDALRTALTRFGAVALAPGAYVSPHDLLAELVGETSEATENDPLLPPELRPAPWRPSQLRREFQERWTAMRRQAPDPSLFRACDIPEAPSA
ncbi:hypothetical protein ABZW30_03985 [Kitasatospora sp. NPDC004669]|uniref:hypothetical protein n=1 Tax=Kitasatospora sp. NPDC004669 TaxID=3154555 RepID=UPI0033A78FF2